MRYFSTRRNADPAIVLDAFTANAAFQSSSNNNTLTITGPETGTIDLITVQRSSVNDDFLEVFIDFKREFTGLAATIDKIVVNAGATNDIINI